MDLPLDQRIARNGRIQAWLLVPAGLFVVFYAAALTLSPAVLHRDASTPLLWGHWLGVLVWGVVFFAAQRESLRRLPGCDPYLLPAAALLSGWGLLTIWSLTPAFGLRQTLWLAVAGVLLVAGFRLPADLRFLRRYKYVWLTGSLLLTGLTLLIGVNPLGYGPRMWLGILGFYFQPSEPLKLLLVAFLAAYLADQGSLLALARDPGSLQRPLGERAEAALLEGQPRSWISSFLPLIAPTLVMVGVAVALLGVQRDLGTAAVLLFLYGVLIYAASQRRRVLVFAGLGVAVSGIAGYFVFDVIRLRVEAWLNPWADPSGRSFQIVQSLLAVSNGGIVGRGPGLGSPELVPVAHSDLIFAALAEQTGLIGVVGLLSLLALIAGRGLLSAIENSDPYRRYLAAGLTAYLVGQSLLIIGGTLRLFPLTGITLPFVSYGGSSLVVSTVSLLLLMVISCPVESPALFPVRPADSRPYLHLGFAFGVGIVLAALLAGWWSVVRSPELLARTDNPRRSVSDRYVRRGAILDRSGEPVSNSENGTGTYVRRIFYPPLSNIVGYTSPTYGQSGLEASLDPYLRGEQGNLRLEVLWNSLVYGQPPPGLDIRLSLDLKLQAKLDRLLGAASGALVLLNPDSGEILALASHPTFDANQLDVNWSELVDDPVSPLLNRASLGSYPIGALDALFPQSTAGLGLSPLPILGLPTFVTASSTPMMEDGQVAYSPLQMAVAAAAVSAGGVRPAPLLVSALNMPGSGWTPLLPLAGSERVLSVEDAQAIAEENRSSMGDFWQVYEVVERSSGQPVTWYLGGVLPSSNLASSSPGARLALALVLESDNPQLAQQIGQAFLSALP